MTLAEAAGLFLACLARLITGAQGHWYGCPPKAEQRIYFANHQSHFDWVLIWAALPRDLRTRTRPIAARDYWTSSPLQGLDHARDLQRGLRQRAPAASAPTDEDPLEPLIEALRQRRLAGDLSRRHAQQQGRAAGLQGRPVPPGREVPGGAADPGLDRQRAARDAQGRGRAGADPVLGDLRCAAAARAGRRQARLPRARARRRASRCARCSVRRHDGHLAQP